ncbi:MAG: hypothetical protein A2096_15215 [Spirochaetes bacterium GWF1_41_5]|nr:MAG: hypothetical protein A2096_15215 [Spirochaetes bacterium GWF1_41_5]HBE03260.1 transketolase [Spirochaetia bacterium]
MLSTGELKKQAAKIRATCVQMAFDARESHLSSALSCTDLLAVLYGGFLRGTAEKSNLGRDRFIMSKGHGCSALYAAMAAYDIISPSLLKEYSRTDGALPNHPCRHALKELEISSGSLGHGLGIAAGMLYGMRLSGNTDSRAVVLMSDGECNEGSVWEAAMFAAAQKFGNLLAVIDHNGSQAVGTCSVIMGDTSLEEKFRSFGWHAVTIRGNDIAAVKTAFEQLPAGNNKPAAVIAKTIPGSGVSFMEKNIEWFYRSPSAEDLKNALAEIGAEPLG